ncbi:MAG: alpha/beta hydrolase [Pseudomonadota bacterium]
MSGLAYFETPQQRRLAYHLTAGRSPGVVFLGGFMSDMDGTKALHLEDWAKREKRAFLRFDYSGHGKSEGSFSDGTIGAWAADAMAAITTLTEGPQVLVGSSMGGWISLLCSKELSQTVIGLVTIAAAPDFTEDSFWAGFDETQRTTLVQNGKIDLPSDYDEPYTITHRLIEEGRDNLILRSPLNLNIPVRFLQGTDDLEVDQSVALRLLSHANGDDIRLTLMKGADHRFSTPECLELIENTLADMLTKLESA